MSLLYLSQPSGGGSNGGGGAGDVAGPASSTDNAVTRYDGTTGKAVQSSAVTIDDNGVLAGARRQVAARTVDFTLNTSTNPRSATSNDGAADIVVGELPAAVLGLEYMFAVHAAQQLIITANGTDVIYHGASVSSAGGTLTSSTVGSATLLTCTKTGAWTSISSGTWATA